MADSLRQERARQARAKRGYTEWTDGLVANFAEQEERLLVREIVAKLRETRDRRKQFGDAVSQAAAAELDYQASELERIHGLEPEKERNNQ